MTEEKSVPQLVDHLFRHQAGQMIASLTRLFGVENLELVEDIVQETLLKALQQWPYRGIPENPGGWLWQVAKNHALDALRREARSRKIMTGEFGRLEPEQIPGAEERHPFGNQLGDDRLSMMFLGCHPCLSRDAQVTLLLKTVGGFHVSEIASAFLQSEATIAQRLVRAKKRLKAEGAHFELPFPAELVHRLDAVLEVLYLIFNEGYESHLGASLVRRDLCYEAIYLCRSILAQPVGRRPKVYALLALMLLHTSRLDARTDENGDLLVLSEQNRTLWDQGLIREGIFYLGLSAQGDELSEYHLQAAIAARHALAKNYESTDWAGILDDYQALLEVSPTPVVMLNRAVAIAMLHGAQAGLQELSRLRDHPALQNYHLLPAAFGELYARSGDFEMAARSYREALELAVNEVERRFLEGRLAKAQAYLCL